MSTLNTSVVKHASSSIDNITLNADGSVSISQISDANLNVLKSNIALLAFKTATNGSLAKYSLRDQIIDEFVDATGIDASASTNEAIADGAYFGTGAGASYPTGGTITDYGDYKVHSFTNVGNTTFTVPTDGTVDVLAIAGGGGGGRGLNGSGGGAGGMVVAAGVSITAGTYTITVGDGGAGGPTSASAATLASQGSNTSISPALTGVATAVGGGAGVNRAKGNSLDGGAGGSGGAAGASGGSAGTATAGQGNVGGTGGCGQGGTAGGGGAGGAGTCRDGGAGLANAYRTGSDVTYASGGSGAEDNNRSNVQTAGGGGLGVGTTGSINLDGSDQAGAANTGGGGGAGGESDSNVGGKGGSGIVVIRYDDTTQFQTTPGGADLTLVSTATTAEASPTKADLVMLIEDIGNIQENTHIKAYTSKDNGSTYTQATLVDEGDWGTNKRILVAHGATPGGSSGTSMRYKITTHSSTGALYTKIHAVSFGWK